MTTKGRNIDEFKKIHHPDADVVYLRQRIQELEAKADQERSATGEAMEIIHSLKAAIKTASPVKFMYSPTNTSRSPCAHVMHITDWHYGEVVEKDEVDGFGAYNPDIAEERVKLLAQSNIDKVHAQRSAYNVPYLHIIGTADYISGGIHYELQVTNAFPEPVQAVKCGYLMGGMLAAFAPHYERVIVDLVTLDNHGRLTRKPQASQGGLNNWSYVVAEVAKQHVANLKNVVVNIHAKPTALVVIGPERYLAFHGHQIKGWAGLPHYGFERRAAMEAIKRMGIPDAAYTRLLIGHYHNAIDGGIWKLGGSLSGTNAFDHSCGRHARPHQTSWFVHPKHGTFDDTKWWL